MAGGTLGSEVRFSSIKGTSNRDKRTRRLLEFYIHSEGTDNAGNSWEEQRRFVVPPQPAASSTARLCAFRVFSGRGEENGGATAETLASPP
jgi:hypothetical protein